MVAEPFINDPGGLAIFRHLPAHPLPDTPAEGAGRGRAVPLDCLFRW